MSRYGHINGAADLESQLHEARQATPAGSNANVDDYADALDGSELPTDQIRTMFANTFGDAATDKLAEDDIRALAKRLVDVSGEANRAKKNLDCSGGATGPTTY